MNPRSFTGSSREPKFLSSIDLLFNMTRLFFLTESHPFNRL